MFLWWSSTKIIQGMMICQKNKTKKQKNKKKKHGNQGAGFIFPIYLYRKL